MMILKDAFAPAVVAETETLVHDSLIRQAGAHLQRLTRRDSLRPERDVAEALRLLHLLLWYLTARKGISAAFMEGESRKRIREVGGYSITNPKPFNDVQSYLALNSLAVEQIHGTLTPLL